MILQRARQVVKAIYPEACYHDGALKEAGLYYRFEGVRHAPLKAFEVSTRLFYGFIDTPNAKETLATIDGLLEQIINAPAFTFGRSYFEGAGLVQEAGFFGLWEIRFKIKLLQE
ncbi:hypothetical protein [Helicobacter heilmannii]|uniref:Uncharacterized protein n=1 Tax=Helicobacter heilmannii TaxID=35817 RepID=A0A0K2XY42_HELHE|nr:hypothetical protein [Helicobacter heilmannii]CCM12351.1 hypothetical protein BN341_8080 [Helicobacter heilmannii ASB1.4]CRF46500.1 hypothetical protein HHE014_15110 [Helicobacter heilmannii]CRF50414.1 hypothetical protein HHE06_02390 [Helicobacter heilmannii]CRI34504.1 hypothetical protein HHE01_13500 [Helicobacter heilmannii]BDQ26910.1 hypothetical protein ASB1_05860 [Helicobacter heilmannii]